MTAYSQNNFKYKFLSQNFYHAFVCECVCVCVCAWEIFEVGNIYNILIKWQWTKYIFNI